MVGTAVLYAVLSNLFQLKWELQELSGIARTVSHSDAVSGLGRLTPLQSITHFYSTRLSTTNSYYQPIVSAHADVVIAGLDVRNAALLGKRLVLVQ